ncbi:MAG: hypothetical protein AAF414_08925 [Pseudomonadota bacterium]
MRIVLGSIAILAVSACTSAPIEPAPTGNTVDPLIIAALPGAEGDGPAEIGLTEEVATSEGFTRLSGEEIYTSLAGNTLISRWRSGRIIERQHHRPSGLRLDDVDFSTLGFTNGVTTLWYVEENGDYCEANVSRRNCGPMFAMDRQFVWFNSAEAEGPYGVRFWLAPGAIPLPDHGPAGPDQPAPQMTVDWDGVGTVTGPAQVYTMMIRGTPMNVAASFELPHPADDTLRCAAIRHPEREGEIRCPDGLSAIGPLGSGDPGDGDQVLMADPDGNQVILGPGTPAEFDTSSVDVTTVTETLDLSL